LPFELPVQLFLEEILVGMQGSPHSEPREQEASGRTRRKWKQLKAVLDTNGMRNALRSLFWIMMGAVMKRVCDESVEELRNSLAKSWAQVVLVVRRKANEGPTGTESETQESLLRSLPHVLVQCMYRLLVDAFPEDRSELTHCVGELLEKLTSVVTYEVSGFQLDTCTWQKERKIVFRKGVLCNPCANQHDNLKSQARQAFVQKRTKESTALKFGQKDALPMEEEQLEHVMMNRSLARDQEQEGWAMTSAHESVPSELSVDRYAGISHVGDVLLQRHLHELDPGLDDMDASTVGPPDDAAEEDSPMRASTTSGKGFNVGRHGKTSRREAGQAEKRRRSDLLRRLILDEPLPDYLCARTVTTDWVSPITDRLVPVERHRQGLRKRACDSRKIKLGLPMKHSQSAPGLEQIKLPQILEAVTNPDDAQHHGGHGRCTLFHVMPVKKREPKPTDLIIEPPGRLDDEVVLGRLEEHLTQFQANSFAEYVQQFDISSGVRKQRMDPTQMRRAESNYVSSLHDLVGPARQPALKMFDSPERKAKRRLMKHR